ncbi:major facilitator superfamily domain-containing protein [Mycena floridula]|nr:major facilitator superfamily domain-containing protein [Mycena floridula]
MSDSSVLAEKREDERLETVVSTARPSIKQGDAALEIIGSSAVHHSVTDEENRRVLRKIDLWVMPVVVLVYFLQQLDKSSLSYTSVFGIVQQTHLIGQQYSWLSSIVYVAQLIWQPVSSYMLVKFPVAKWLFINVFLWGLVVACAGGATNFQGLLASRFFLGIFEATVAPAFITITQMWWRRREQTMRLSIWMAMNGGTGMVGSLLAWGLGHIKGNLKPYQTIFIFIGLFTVVCSPTVYFILPDSPAKARFLSHEEKIVAIERLRANNQGTESKVWRWEHFWELVLDVKTYLWFALLFLCAVPSGGIGAFGPLIIQGFGFDQFETILFNIPFAALQVIVTLLSAYISTKIKLKWPVIFALTLPPIGGASALYILGRDPALKNKLLGCYYVLSFFTAIQPMLYTWSSQNTAGHTKKLCTTAVVFVAQCAGNIVGPLLYTTDQKPYYHKGLIANLICWIALSCLTLVTALYLAYLNKRQAAVRVRKGKSAVVHDKSLDEYNHLDRDEAENNQAFDDLSDRKNEDFIYVL